MKQLLTSLILLIGFAATAHAQSGNMLSRALWASIATKPSSGELTTNSTYKTYYGKVLVSWRMLPGDDENTTFDLYRKIGSGTETQLNIKASFTGGLQDELFDKGALNDGKWQRLLSCGNYGNSVTYGSKANPLLIADFLGDWREEIVMFDKTDSCTLNIFSTVKPTEHRIPTLMHDHIYRMSVAWQNVGYNQPSHLGFFLPDYKRLEEEKTGIRATTTGSEAGHAQNFDLYGRHIGADKAKGLYIVKEGSNVVKKLIR